MKNTIDHKDIDKLMQSYDFNKENIDTINEEGLLSVGMINRLHSAFPKLTGFGKGSITLFAGKAHYSGLKGFREIVQILKAKDIQIKDISERSFLSRYIVLWQPSIF